MTISLTPHLLSFVEHALDFWQGDFLNSVERSVLPNTKDPQTNSYGQQVVVLQFTNRR